MTRLAWFVSGLALMGCTPHKVKGEEVRVTIDLSSEPYLISWTPNEPVHTVEVLVPSGDTDCDKGDVIWADTSVDLMTVYSLEGDLQTQPPPIDGPVAFGSERKGLDSFLWPDYEPGEMFVQIGQYKRYFHGSRLSMTGCVKFDMP